MIYLPSVRGLRISGDVIGRGEPNKECIALNVTEQIDMGQFGVMLGWLQSPGLAVPIKDFFFYFGPGKVQIGDWVFLYTGLGQPEKYAGQDGVSTIYRVYWGRPTTLFANSNIVPLLFQLGGVEIGESPQNQPQLGLLTQNKLLNPS